LVEVFDFGLVLIGILEMKEENKKLLNIVVVS